MSPLSHSTTGGRIATWIVALAPSMKKITTAKNLANFGRGMLPWQPILSLEKAASRHFPPSLFVLALYNGLEDHKKYTHTETPDEPSRYCKNFVNYTAVNY